MSRARSFRPELEALEIRTVPSVTPLDVANAITHSAEAESRQITADYVNLLHRPPSQLEIDNWLPALNAGMTYETMESAFLASQEYFNDHGGTAAGWIQGMYQDELGRLASPSEVQAWMGLINQRDTIANAITTSPEGLAHRVTLDYEAYLDRMPGAGEAAAWVPVLQSGMTDQVLIANLVASPEFIDGQSGDDFHQWVGDVYQKVLGRPASELEIDMWLNQMNIPISTSTGPDPGTEDPSNNNCNFPSTPPPSDPTINTGYTDPGTVYQLVDTSCNTPDNSSCTDPTYTDPSCTDPGYTDPGYTDSSGTPDYSSYSDPSVGSDF
jgi:hypothetical protein